MHYVHWRWPGHCAHYRESVGVQMSIAHINGIDVFYLTDGDPHKPAIIFSNSLSVILYLSMFKL